jgi:hypothetical protein
MNDNRSGYREVGFLSTRKVMRSSAIKLTSEQLACYSRPKQKNEYRD